ncbi:MULTISPECIES: hypothetical protein [unclassified Sphingobium]|uniref:hypothetical protein n=1 Tax=unclassified Sphingobium TaxID=2611147 RepID=UPI0011A97FF3|nr:MULTISPECIES: hypothetical protein [unclassified Sphingobium]
MSYTADMADPDHSWLELSYTLGSGDSAEKVKQHVSLCHTTPNYGGKRWWMICPYRHTRAGKLYRPNEGDRFASRQAWQLGYHIQRVSHRDRAFERLFRLQRKLGCNQGWEAGLRRPKGMWDRTFREHFERYLQLEERCDAEMKALIDRL